MSSSRREVVPVNDANAIDSSSQSIALDGLISVVLQVASIEAARSDATASGNALSVLLSAIATESWSSIESGIVDSTSQPATVTATTSSSSTAETSANAYFTSATSPTSSATLTSTTSITTSASHQITSTPSTLSTIIQSSSTTHNTAGPSLAATAASSTTSSNSQSLKAGAIAGVTTGIAAAFVFAALLGALLWQRRQKGPRSPLFSRLRSSRSSADRVYPEIAWLYDPSPSPPLPLDPNRSQSSAAALLPLRLPHEEHGMAELDGADSGGGRGSPDLRLLARPSSPLLPPLRAQQQPLVSPEEPPVSPRRVSAGSEYSRNSRNSSWSDAWRPLTAISEEAHAQ